MVSREGYDKHYPSGEPGTHGREPFEDPDTQSSGLDTKLAAGSGGHSGAGAGAGGGYGQTTGLGSGGLASDSHGGTLSRDTEVRGGQVVGLGGPTDSGPGHIGGSSHVASGPGAGHSHSSHSHGVGSVAPAAGAGAAGFGAGAAHSSSTRPHGEEQSTVAHGDSLGARGRDSINKTGNLDQEAFKYESTGARGPTSSGAANTDKFDTGSSNYGSSGAAPPPTVEQDDSHRKGTGGIGGILGTTDREFTANPSRTGEGAYHDSHGTFKTNTDGPSGQTALTGREGTTEHNPVAQAQSRSQGGAPAGTATDGTDGEKKGVMDKIKDAFK